MNSPPLILLAGLAGGCFGSASATAAIRVSRGEPFLRGRSHCDSCSVTLKYVQTIPVLSHLHHRGSCRACGAKIDRSHLWGELLGAAAGISAVIASSEWSGVLLFFLGQLMVAASLIDARILRLPDILTAGCAALAIGLAAASGRDHLVVGVISALAVIILLLALAEGHRRARGIEGLGLGDIKLAGALAIWLGGTIFFAIALASAGALVAKRFVHPQSVQIPFGPYIAAAAWIIGLGQVAWDWAR